jgi:hypothetical protein
MTGNGNITASRVKLAFESTRVFLRIDQLVPLKVLRPGVREGKKYAQILSSVRAVGLVEDPVVIPNPKQLGKYFLLDGHLRIEALKDLGVEGVACLMSTNDDTYTFNKRVNRLAAVQEHRMIVRAVERGVPENRIAEALGLDVLAVRRRFKLLDGICLDAAELLGDKPCPMKAFDLLREMLPIRQIEAAELMIGQNNFSTMFAQALLMATPQTQLAAPRKKLLKGTASENSEQIARMERELASLQSQVKSVEDSFGVDNLHLTVAKGYITKLLANARIVRWLSKHRQEYLGEFQSIAEIEKIGGGVNATAR